MLTKLTYSIVYHTNMKAKIFIVLTFLGNLFFANAQTSSKVKLYGYIQPVSMGMKAKRHAITDDGKIEKNTSDNRSSNYKIYITAPAKPRIYPAEIWIKGTHWAANPVTINETPVVATNDVNPNHPTSVTLVPKTPDKVMILEAVPLVNSKNGNKGTLLAKTHEVVVLYKMNGRFYYATLKTLSALAPMALQ